MNKKAERFILVAGILTIVLCFGSFYSNYLDKKIDQLYTSKIHNNTVLGSTNYRDKGNEIIAKDSRNGNLFVMGSSELSSPVSQNIKFNFPNTIKKNNVSIIGHAYVQNALHAMDIGANNETLGKSNIVIIESIQWFFDNDINSEGFMSNFSELQFYEFLHNDKLDRKTKEYLCNRFLEIEQKYCGTHYKKIFKIADNDCEYAQTHILAKLYLSKNIFGKTLYQVMRPYYYARNIFLCLKDKYNSYQYLKQLEPSSKSLFEADWTRQLENAEKEGKAACKNNDIYVYDEYFDTYLKDTWKDAMGNSIHTSIDCSKEWDDLEFLFSVCKQLDVKPLFINVSTNGRYYDYIGISEKKRKEYYYTIASKTEKNNFDIYNGLTRKEYEPYVFADVMHLGWKGWIYVTKAITEYFE